MSIEWTDQHTHELHQAAEALNVAVRAEARVLYAQSGATMIATPAANLETIPATNYPQGVDLGTVYLDLAHPLGTRDAARHRIPPGTYRARAISPEVREPGKLEGHVQLVDAAGHVAAELPANFDVRSLRVPPEARNQRTLISVTTKPTPLETVVMFCWTCPNGVVCCVFFRVYFAA